MYLLHKLPTWGPWDVEATRRAPISKSPSISWVTSTISSKVKLVVFFSSKKRIHSAYRFQISVLHALFNHWESLASFKKSWLIIKLVKMQTCNMYFNFMQIPPLVGHNVVTFYLMKLPPLPNTEARTHETRLLPHQLARVFHG